MRERAAHRDALIQLSHLRRADEGEQLRLSHEDDLNQLLTVGLEVREHADLLEELGRQVLCLVKDRNAGSAVRELLQEEGVETVEQLLTRGGSRIAQAELGEECLKHLHSIQERIEDQRDAIALRIELLEQIATFGSISAAARGMEMSYKHAWDLVEDMNRVFGKPLVAAQTGGRKGGGAQLTAVGLAVVSRFRAIERAAASAAAVHMQALQAEIDAG